MTKQQKIEALEAELRKVKDVATELRNKTNEALENYIRTLEDNRKFMKSFKESPGALLSTLKIPIYYN